VSGSETEALEAAGDDNPLQLYRVCKYGISNAVATYPDPVFHQIHSGPVVWWLSLSDIFEEYLKRTRSIICSSPAWILFANAKYSLFLSMTAQTMIQTPRFLLVRVGAGVATMAVTVSIIACVLGGLPRLLAGVPLIVTGVFGASASGYGIKVSFNKIRSLEQTGRDVKHRKELNVLRQNLAIMLSKHRKHDTKTASIRDANIVIANCKLLRGDAKYK